MEDEPVHSAKPAGIDGAARIDASLNNLQVPAAHRKYVRTTNLTEPILEEARPRA